MPSMWTALSDRDYYDSLYPEVLEEEEPADPLDDYSDEDRAGAHGIDEYGPVLEDGETEEEPEQAVPAVEDVA